MTTLEDDAVAWCWHLNHNHPARRKIEEEAMSDGDIDRFRAVLLAEYRAAHPEAST